MAARSRSFKLDGLARSSAARARPGAFVLPVQIVAAGAPIPFGRFNQSGIERSSGIANSIDIAIVLYLDVLVRRSQAAIELQLSALQHAHYLVDCLIGFSMIGYIIQQHDGYKIVKLTCCLRQTHRAVNSATENNWNAVFWFDVRHYFASPYDGPEPISTLSGRPGAQLGCLIISLYMTRLALSTSFFGTTKINSS